MSRSLSSLAIASANAQETDEVWLAMLRVEHADIVPGGVLRFVANNVDVHQFPGANLLLAPDLSTWTAVGTLSQAADGAYRALTESDAGALGHYRSSVTGLTSGTTYTFAVRVKKDAVPASTRFAGWEATDFTNGSSVRFDTSTGAYLVGNTGTGHVGGGVVDDGDAWIVYVTRTGFTAYTFNLFPAIGVDPTFVTALNGATGTISANTPWAFAGDIDDLLTYIAFPFQIDLPGEDPDQPSVARLRIDNVDRQIVEAIRGLSSAPKCDIEVVLASQPNTVEIGFYDLTLRVADYDALFVDGSLSFEEIFTEPVSLEMTPSRFPGLF